MPKIVHIEFKRRRPERFLISMDDGEAYLFSPETVVKYGFAIEKEFREDAFLEILRVDGVQRAKDQILKYLGIRPHSRKELLLKTLKKGFAPEHIETALRDLERVGLIDDQQFSRLFTQNELLLRPCGKKLLKEKLLKRGVSPKIFQSVLDEIFEKQPQEQIIKQIAQKFLNKNSRLPKQKRLEKLIRHLQNKGFDWAMINWVIYDERMSDFQAD